MKKIHKILLASSIFVAMALTSGSVFAAWAVTDKADPIAVQIGLKGTHIVTFLDENGDEYYSEYVIDGNKLSTPPSNPTKSGYAFDGWATNATTLDKVDVDFSTKTYTEDVTYRPRFASYGYKKSTGSATHLDNKWDINNNVTLNQNDVVSVGTYIYGKNSLENVAESTVTITNGGGYAVVCGSNEAAWNATDAGTFSNWKFEKYYTLELTSNWDSLSGGIYSHYFYDSTHVDDRKMQLVPGSTRTYYSYCPYNMTKVIFLALWADNNTNLNNDWNNVKYRMPEITLASGTNAYEMIDISFGVTYDTHSTANGIFLVGDFSYSGSSNWCVTAQYQLTCTGSDYWTGTYSFVKGVTINYKYYNSTVANPGSWSSPEGGSNRTLTVDGTTSDVINKNPGGWQK